jgi:hypothetical protein
MARADGTKLVRLILEADAFVLAAASHTVNSVVIKAIYGERLPDRPLVDSAAAASGKLNQLATAIVVRSFGGTRDESGGPARPRVLVRCYGPSTALARDLAMLVDDTIHDETFDVVDGGQTYRMVTELSAGPNSDVEPTTSYIFSDMIYSTTIL